MEFANKEYLLLLLLLIPYIIWYVMYRKKTEPTMRMSDTFAFRYAPKSWKVVLMPLSMFLRILAFVMIVLVLARPQTQNSWKSETVEGRRSRRTVPGKRGKLAGMDDMHRQPLPKA